MEIEKLINKNFPFQDFRNQQYSTINTIIQSLNSNKHFILESPTGVGKSVVAYTVTKSLLDINEINLKKREDPPVIICTSTRQLQKQYIESFKNQEDVEFIWSAQNYKCDTYYELENTDDKVYFGHSMCMGKKCPNIDSCEYLIQKNKFLKCKIGITNYQYFMNNCKLNPEYLVCDESQNLEKILGDIATIILSERSLITFSNNILRNSNSINHVGISKFIEEIKLLSVKNDVKEDDIREYVNSFIEHFDPIFEKLTSELEQRTKKLNVKDKIEREKISKLAKTQRSMESILDKYDKYKHSKTQWIISERLNDTENHKLKIKPLEVFEYFNDYIGCRVNKIIFMSATICGVNEFAKTLGIDNDNYEYLETKSIIPIKNRTVYYCSNVGSMNYKNKYEILPKFIEIIDRIIKYQFNQKSNKNINGIIHSVSYDNAEYIKKHSKYKNNIIIPTRHELMNLNDHILNKQQNTVIVSPSILEGIDLIDELSRFQIFIKVPFSFLGDLWVKTKMNKNKKWYSREAIIKIIQGCGRSIRSEDDWAETFIIDNNFGRLITQNNELFPTWFKESIKTVKV